MTEQNFQFHEIASIFPLMEGKEFEDLKEDIEKNGLLEPIWLYEGEIIDGRNRYRACMKLGIEPRFREYEPETGVSAVDFVVSMNLKRRHLTPSQVAMVAIDSLPFYEEEAKKRQISTLKNVQVDREEIPPQEKGKARDIVGEKFGINGKYVSDAKTIKEFSNTLANKVRSGKITIPKALIKIRRQQQIDKMANVAKSFNPEDDIGLFHADFHSWCYENIDDDSIDLIITDPPYDKDSLHLYDKLGEVAKHVLKPGKFLVVYAGQFFLPDVIKMLNRHLKYHWVYCLSFKRNGTEYRERNVINRWKLILVYYKGSTHKSLPSSVDLIPDSGCQKQFHEWQQNTDGFEHMIDAFSEPNDLILDPMMGTGTSILVCKKLKRQAIGIDNSDQAIELCKGRILEDSDIN